MRSRFLVPLLGAIAALFIASAPARAEDNGLPAFKLCGPTTVTGQQCVIPNADGTITLGGGSGDASAANQATQITKETAIAAALGTTADSACGTDTGTCALIALFKRWLQGMTTLNATAAASVPAGTSDIGSVQLWAQPSSWVTGTLTSAMTSTTDTSLLAAPGANLNNYLVTIVCGNSHATVGTGVNIKDGSGGTVIGWVPAAAVYGGTAVNFNIPLKQPTANTALYVADDTSGASVKCTATGFKR